jgi:uncharacterized delta-60 repeat protein
MAIQADGKILVGGYFDTLGGQPRKYIGRLNPDGTLDNEFNPCADDVVHSLAVQADGKILVGGGFTTLCWQPRNHIGRLNPDGTLDTGFNPGASSYVYSLAIQTDGKILVGGGFATLCGQPRNYIGRLNPDGTLDSAFNATAGSFVNCMAMQADGKILVGGAFFSLCGQPRTSIGRLNPDGTLDNGFNPEASSYVYSLAAQTDGRILVGGWFTTLCGQPRNHIGRLNPDGTLDTGFNSGADGSVFCLTVQADGKILVGGDFATVGGQARSHIARLNTIDLATQGLSYEGSTITWVRGGSGPEVWHTTFEWSDDGLLWKPLGEGFRLSGGWQFSNAIVPAQATIRARGFVAGGHQSNTGWFVEDYWGPLVWIAQPVSRTNDAGSTATFHGMAGGSPPISHQWFKSEMPITDGTNVTGSTTAQLTLPHVLGADAGDYYLVVSNAYGARTGEVATLTVNDPAIAVQPVSQNRELGQSTTLSVTAWGTAPLGYQWWKDGVELAGRTGSTMDLTNLVLADAGTYRVTVRSPYGSATSSEAWLTVNGATLNTGFNPGAGGSVSCFGLQPDGKILVGGTFTTLGGQPRRNLGLLNPDGSLDNGFNPGADSAVFSLVVQADGKILVGGYFYTLDGQPRNSIGRLNPDGTLDDGFDPGANSAVSSLAVQADGKILVGGRFTSLGGQPRGYIGRLNPDGTLDNSFNPRADTVVDCIAVQADGKILVGGYFYTLDGQPRNSIGRLNPDGTLDDGFNPRAEGSFSSVVVQADGKILVAGAFTSLGGQPRNSIGRLNPDGTLDDAFNPRAEGSFSSVAVQADGKILVAGAFTSLGGQPRNSIGRLNPDGRLDTGFNPGADGSVSSLALQADGNILVGGSFTSLGGQPRNSIGRLNATAPAIHNLNCDGSIVSWLRGSTSPEVNRTTFDWSRDGQLWIPLGDGIRIPGGWQCTNVSLPTDSTLRARGFVATDSSGWFLDDYWGPLVWVTQLVSRTNNAGSTATLSSVAGGTGPLSYQWYKNGVTIIDDAHVVGAGTAWLTLTDVLGIDAGNYHLVVSNAYGAQTSVLARLTVNDPAITVPPVTMNREPGESATLSTAANGTAPLSYQWWKDGMELPGRTEPSITLTNLGVADAGGYRVVATSPYGNATSSVAWLTVNGTMLDPGFNPKISSSVSSLAVQADGKILVGGAFGTGGEPRYKYIARLDPEGTLDRSFNPEADGPAYCVAVQADGRILVGGGFATMGGQKCDRIGRLDPNGSLDTEFNPGADSTVNSLVVQVDGKILLGGWFTTLGGQPRNRIGRLNADGTLDASFNSGTDGPVYCVGMQPDGRILLSGQFNTLGGEARDGIARLDPDGTLDYGFAPTSSGYVYCMAIQADGKILVGGTFTILCGQPRNRIGRLNSDGTLDMSFNPSASSDVHCVAVQADGKILVGGAFTTLGSQPRRYIGRVDSDGTLDTTFNPGADSSIFCLAVQADGEVLVGGRFTKLAGQARDYIGRLYATDPATQSLNRDDSTITWLRGGTSPEICYATFEYSTNGEDWWSIGTGTRIPGGWQLSGRQLPSNSTIRARGPTTGGRYNGSSWFVESVLIPSVPPAAPMLSVESVTGESIWFRLTGGTNVQHLVQTTTNLSSAEAEWQPVTTLTLTNGWSLFDWTNAGETHRFFRAK